MLHTLRLPSFLLATLLLLGMTANAMAQAGAPFVSLEAARAAIEQSSQIVIDIREPDEHATGVAKGALLIPMSQLGKRLAELPQPAKQPFLVICNTQNRSSRVVEQLRTMGYTNASYVKGGMSLWAARGWPMVKP
ncbi:rhodanese-like domain-containing protein [Polaromonas sp. AER18D-145]|uniref:rhodanese-like domain-containing protein n=1 Tax=Polaromonas sp. AER18D-145 TaxID=1977060 RepID=UPI000BBC8DD7|nr:rhodanese-like domain-containing protein [Polaromonas sp. AER18D-145]